MPFLSPGYRRHIVLESSRHMLLLPITVSNTNTTRSKKDIERSGERFRKLKRLCPYYKNHPHPYMILLSPFVNSTEWNFRKKEVAYHVITRQHENFVFLNFDFKEVLSILLWLLVNSILTTGLFIIWTSTVKFLIGPRWLVPNPLVYKLMPGSSWKFSYQTACERLQNKIITILKADWYFN